MVESSRAILIYCGNSETCTTPSPIAGLWYARVKAYQTFSNVTKTISGAQSQDSFYTMNVPSGASNLSFATSGGSGDADLYVRFGQQPTASTYDCRPYAGGNNETCNISNVQTGTYHIMIRGYNAYSNVSLKGSYNN